MTRAFGGGLTLVLAAVVALSAGQGRAADKMKVVATFSVIGDMVANVAGDQVELVTIVGPDGDTELYQPTLADSRSVAQAPRQGGDAGAAQQSEGDRECDQPVQQPGAAESDLTGQAPHGQLSDE